MNFLLIGKPNVGKSSIFNILTSGKKSIIHKKEGTTIDWHKNQIKGLENIFLHDSPGVIINDKKINSLNFIKIFKEIDIFLYVLDKNNSQNNIEIASINALRTLNKKIILIINKDDNYEKNIYFDSIGIKDIFYLSCSHNHGFGEIYEYFENLNSKTKFNVPILIIVFHHHLL